MNFSLSNMRMPKIKVSVRFIAFVLALIGGAFFYWTNMKLVPEIEKETAKLTTANTTLSKKENDLATLYNNMSFYLNETDSLNKQTEEVLSVFPTFMYLEDKILYADTLLKTDLKGYNLSSFAYGQSAYVMSVKYGESQKQMELYSVAMSGHYQDLSYVQIKEILNYGLSASRRFVLNNITMSYNEKTGYLTGDFAFTTYFINGQQKRYEFPDEVIQGLGNSNRVDNLFGTRK